MRERHKTGGRASEMEQISRISFPGLGIGEFSLDNVAFTVFGRPVMWYGVIICIGIILSFSSLYFLFA